MSSPEPRILVRANGPYHVEGPLRLLRTAIARTDRGEPSGWDEGPEFAVDASYDLCRCGGSATKPLCDRACETNGFDGRETAGRGPIAERRSPWKGAGVVLYDDRPLCTHAGFCTAGGTTAWGLADRADDPGAREALLRMVHACPSGRLEVAEEDDPETTLEPVFEPSIGVEPDASYWIRGGVPVVSADGVPYEARNRQTLCRCGHSANKPFCDGAHRRTGFLDPANPASP